MSLTPAQRETRRQQQLENRRRASAVYRSKHPKARKQRACPAETPVERLMNDGRLPWPADYGRISYVQMGSLLVGREYGIARGRGAAEAGSSTEKM